MKPVLWRLGTTTRIACLFVGVIPIACHGHVPVRRGADVDREVKDTSRVVAVRDTSVAVLFTDTISSGAFFAGGQTFRLQTSRERQALRAAIKKERDLWRSSKPGDYEFLLRVDCFCPGTRGWLLMEVRNGQPLRARDRSGKSAPLTDWNTLSIDRLYDNLEHAADGDGEVQIVFAPRWHFPAYMRTSAARVPDAWSITEARGFRPLK
jgi:uncharacterized protein DUF6174